MRVAMLTREYPPDIYGGAGVHVEHLARVLREHVDLTVHCWGRARPDAVGHRAWDALAGEERYLGALRALAIDLTMSAAAQGADVVHSHTWYTQLGGHLAKLVHGLPHVTTVHSLEPLRPWKEGQLGGGYHVSEWIERTALETADAIVAVSEHMRGDVLACYPELDERRVHVIYNGVDVEEYAPDARTDALARHGVDPGAPTAIFVGRITHQKGVPHLLRAAHGFDAAIQLVLCAGAADTPELARETEQQVAALRAERERVVWIEEMVPHDELVQLLTHATVFVCPSIYEPLGIVNLEAMACETAVVATATGGIVEVVDDGVTGLLVPFEPRDDGTHEPREPSAFAAGIAERVNRLCRDPDRAAAMGRAGRSRAIERFSWDVVGRETAALYAAVASGAPASSA
jgi:alpha-maltose-1-phosphate synthase